MSFRTGCKAMALIAFLGLGGVVHAQQADVWRPQAEVERLQTEIEQPPDPARGKKLFKTCRKCHEVEPGQVKIGPSLAGVVGRPPGSVPEFGYSNDMIDYGASGVVWNEQTLDRFLTKPRALINGTKMVFQGFRKPNDRDDLIAYLSTIRG
ncbi:MAG: cytochrome c family protein [Alphaproteobacteria bacterium]|nr:cytochrome c family protein [Alphaproteobacteria bacterium]